MEFAAIDFETTGYEDGNVNEPWQLGFALVRDGEIVETREWFFRTSNPDFQLSTFNVQPSTTLLESYTEWAPHLVNRRLVAHNIATERTILTRVAPLTKWGPWTDTLKFAKARYPKLPSYQLCDLCETFGCVPQFEGRTWHDGLYDAIACALLAVRLGGFLI